jgi:hypothetical protein
VRFRAPLHTAVETILKDKAIASSSPPKSEYQLVFIIEDV